MAAPLTPRPRGTIYEALHSILEHVCEGPGQGAYPTPHMLLLMENDGDALTSLTRITAKVNYDVA